jgi:L-iditol 2-dehydrogenase
VKAAFLTALRTMEVRETPEPTIERDTDVLVRVATVGVCGSDMHYFRTGRIGAQVVQYPWIVGHECAGTVEKVGPGVTTLRPGDRVAVDPLIVCGQCDQCLGGREHTCRRQAFLGCPGQVAGSLAELLVMPERSCFRTPADMTPSRATLLEPFSIGLYAQRLAGDVRGKTVLVLGSGPIGLCTLLALKHAGAGRVYMTDIRDDRRRLAETLGADWTGNPESEDIVATVSKAEPLGVDFAYECAGEQETLDQAVNLLKPGGMLLIVGIPELDRISFPMDQLRRRELRIQNVRRQNECVQPAMDLVASGEIDLDPLLTHEYPLDRTQEAFDTVADYRDGVIKAMIHLT